jgi:hypothetical protein
MVSEILIWEPIGKHPLVTRRMKQGDNINIIINDRPRDCEKYYRIELGHDPVH